MAKLQRSIGSLRRELVMKSREAALTAIRVFNDPQVSFKSETFVVLMMIAWTYLLHAHYRVSESSTATTDRARSAAYSTEPSTALSNSGS